METSKKVIFDTMKEVDVSTLKLKTCIEKMKGSIDFLFSEIEPAKEQAEKVKAEIDSSICFFDSLNKAISRPDISESMSKKIVKYLYHVDRKGDVVVQFYFSTVVWCAKAMRKYVRVRKFPNLSVIHPIIGFDDAKRNHLLFHMYNRLQDGFVWLLEECRKTFSGIVGISGAKGYELRNEIVSLQREFLSNVSTKSYLSQENDSSITYSVKFDTSDEMLDKINDYVMKFKALEQKHCNLIFSHRDLLEKKVRINQLNLTRHTCMSIMNSRLNTIKKQYNEILSKMTEDEREKIMKLIKENSRTLYLIDNAIVTSISSCSFGFVPRENNINEYLKDIREARQKMIVLEEEMLKLRFTYI
jgi:hypothetical protein